MVYQQIIKVLLVEDSEDDYLITRQILERVTVPQFKLKWAKTYDAALKAIADEKWDVCLLDIHLDRHTGLDILRYASTLDSDLPIIMLTGTANYEVDVVAMEMGATDFLAKTEMNAALLERTIRYAIRHKQAEAQLKQLNASLERKVEERTQLLREELYERYRVQQALTQSEARFRRVFESNMIGIFFTTLEGTILEANSAFLNLIGYVREEMLSGMLNWRSLIPEAYHPLIEYSILQADRVYGANPSEVELVHKSGRPILVLSGGADLGRSQSGRVCFVLDISERKQAEEKIRASLKEKEVLLAEIHHRVKNNLQLISSLLNLQANRINNAQILEAFRYSQSQIRAMALIHERLYQTEHFAAIDFAGYLATLATELLDSFEDLQPIQLDIHAEPTLFNLDTAIPCGLIVNELITNAIKHAFVNRPDGKITITLHSVGDGNHILTIADNGVGLPESIDLRQASSLGLKLISLLTQQLRGHLEIEQVQGTSFRLTLKKEQKV